MKTIGIKLADGTFYPVIEEGKIGSKKIDLTTVQGSQTIVHVDVYRSETNSMEDAEYVDTLEIQNLQTKGEDLNDLNLKVGIDENNQLKAEIVEKDTGKSSETEVDLDSIGKNNNDISFEADKTAETPEITASDTISEIPSEEIKEEPVIPESDIQFDTVTDDFISEDISDVNIDTTPEDLKAEDISLPVFDSDGFASNNENPEAVPDELTDVIIPEPKDDSADADLASLQDPNPLEEDINLDALAEDTVNETDELSLPKFEESNNSPDAAESVSDDLSLPDFGDSSETAESTPVTDLSLDDLDIPSDTPVEENVSKNEDDLSLPNFDNLEPTSLDSEPAKTESSPLDSLSLDDLDSNNSVYSKETLSSINESFNGTDATEDDFFASDENKDIFDDKENSEGMFEDLFDEETKEGKSASYSEDEDEKKQLKTPVIICIICAAICIIAAIITLCIVPSRLQRNKTESKQSVQKAAKADSIIPENTSKEETIMVYSNPENVVPSIPETDVSNQEAVKYKIIWGDTLWDISYAYYKTPWKYNFIANYNGIKNPDKIIAGTYILIPAR